MKTHVGESIFCFLKLYTLQTTRTYIYSQKQGWGHEVRAFYNFVLFSFLRLTGSRLEIPHFDTVCETLVCSAQCRQGSATAARFRAAYENPPSWGGRKAWDPNHRLSHDLKDICHSASKAWRGETPSTGTLWRHTGHAAVQTRATGSVSPEQGCLRHPGADQKCRSSGPTRLPSQKLWGVAQQRGFNKCSR